MAFSTFTVLYNHHYYLTLEHFRNPKKKPHIDYAIILRSSPLSPCHTRICFVSTDLPILDISDKWNHAIHDFFCFASFALHNVSRLVCGYFILIYGWIMYFEDTPRCVYPFLSWWIFGLTLWLLWMMLPWAHLFKHLFSICWGKYLGEACSLVKWNSVLISE